MQRTGPGTVHGLTQLALDLLSWLSICSRVLSVAWVVRLELGLVFGVRFEAPSPPGSRHSVHDACVSNSVPAPPEQLDDA